MQFHLPSFLLGYGSGIATALFAKRLQPIVVQLGVMARQLVDRAGAVVSMRREDLEDAVAETRRRGRAASSPARMRTSSVKRAGARRVRSIRTAAARR